MRDRLGYLAGYITVRYTVDDFEPEKVGGMKVECYQQIREVIARREKELLALRRAGLC